MFVHRDIYINMINAIKIIAKQVSCAVEIVIKTSDVSH